MANSKSNVYTIPLDSAIETNDFKGEIKKYSGFNEKNAFYRNNALTPFFRKEMENQSAQTVIDNNGTQYSIKNNALVKINLDGTEKAIFPIYRTFTNKTVFENGEDILSLYDAETYLIEKSDGYVYAVMGQNETKLISNYSYSNFQIIKAFSYYYVICGMNFYIIDSNGAIQYTEQVTGLIGSEGAFCCYRNGKVWLFYNIHASSQGKEKTVTHFNLYNYSTPSKFQNATTIAPTEQAGYVDSRFYTDGIFLLQNIEADGTHSYILNLDFDYNLTRTSKKITSVTISSCTELSSKVYFNRTMTLKVSVVQYVYNSKYFVKTVLFNSSTAGKIIDEIALTLNEDGVEINQGLEIFYNNFELLFNNGFISGISSSRSLLTEWFSIDVDFLFSPVSSREIYYKGNDRKIYKLTQFNDTSAATIRFYDNHIFVNCDGVNCYDIEKDRYFDFAEAFNNSLYLYDRGLENGNAAKTYENIVADNLQKQFVSAINPLFELQDEHPSILLNPVKINIISKSTAYSIAGNFSRLGSKEMNCFMGDVGSACKYVFNGNKSIDSKLIGTTYPIDTTGNILFSPNLFSRFIDSYINKDMIVNNGIGYPLIYSNNKLVYGYYFLSMLENLSEMFCIQGQIYAISDNKIFSVLYSNGVIASSNVVANILNFRFIGNTTNIAYFWNEINKSIYVFNGANILEKFSEAYELKEIVSSNFNVTTQTIFIITPDSVYLLNDQICEIKIKDVIKVENWKKGFAFITSDKVHYFSYVSDSGFESEKLKIETCFYGEGDNVVTVTDCLYLRLFDSEMKAGTVDVEITTISNEGQTTEETAFNIRETDWDKKTNSVYLRYQLPKQRALGVSFAITSPFAISYMGVGSQAETLLVDKVSQNAIIKTNKIDF